MSADDVLGEDTRRSLASGRRTIGDMVGAAQHKGRRIFVVFAAVLLGAIYAMRVWIWPILEADLLAREASIVAVTPFDVILLQAKIGILLGILASIPPFLYYAREPLKARGLYPEDGVDTWKLAGIVVLMLALFLGGVAYSYNVFFPVMFTFLADNAVSAGITPTYSIVDWTQFILVLGLAFGIAAQLPLAMTALAYADIVSYETFRDKWKHAVVVMFGFGALFSPPDPFTQVMWAGPLVVLYGLSLYLTRFAVAFKRGRDRLDLAGSLRGNATTIAGTGVAVAGVAWWLLDVGVGYLNRLLLPRLPAAYRPSPVTPGAWLPVSPDLVPVVLAIAIGTVAAGIVALYAAWPRLEPAPGAPADIDLDDLDAAGVRAAPPEAFAGMGEADAVAAARHAMEAEGPEKARAILDRFDAAEDADDGSGDAGDADEASGGGVGGALGRTTAGVVNAFSEDEVEDDDIGGYYYDLAFVFDSLRSKAFRLFLVFITVLVGVFGFLYSGGIGLIKRDFIRRLPVAVRPEEVNIITLHPVEALVFEVKLATLLGVVAIIPMVFYYAWPALESRGIASGDRNTFYGWGGAIIAGLVLGSVVGYLYIAPAVISYFVFDALRAGMVISYRVSNFFWLVFFTTAGIGLLLDVPVTMVLFHRGGIVTYPTMRRRWRVVTLGILVAAAVLTPAGVLSMVLVTIPIMAAYALGLGVLWVYTLGGRRTPRAAVDPG